jgi:putative polymerase
MRPQGQGRGLLSFLGEHRVSSVFLEPVSMGNFAVILAAWGLAHDDREWRKIVGFVFAAALFTVAADARFASASIAVVALARLSGAWRFSWAVPMLPIVAVAGLIVWALINAGSVADDTFPGRLLHTGLILSNLEAGEWLGVQLTSFGVLDAGYAYAAQSFGLVFFVVSWAAFALVPTPSDMSARLRFSIALYIVLLLCISGTSLFSIKTGALMWFMLGSVCSERNRSPVYDGAPSSEGEWLGSRRFA